MDDEFEYHVVFSQWESGIEDETSTDLRITDQDGKEPVIFLIGWLNCKDKYLAKYSDYYEKKGCTVIRYIAPPKDILSWEPRVKLQSHISKLVTALHDYSLTEQPIIFHIFSNGGAIVYDLISRELQKENNAAIKIRGCIFDSSPGKTTFQGLCRVLTPLQPGGPLCKRFLGFLSALFLTFLFCLKSLGSLFVGQKPDLFRANLWWRLAREPRSHPQMFLCSQADSLIRHDHILDFMAEREDRGVNVSSVVWPDTAHVAHFRKHPNSYVTHCLDFVRMCLASEMDQRG